MHLLNLYYSIRCYCRRPHKRVVHGSVPRRLKSRSQRLNSRSQRPISFPSQTFHRRYVVIPSTGQDGTRHHPLAAPSTRHLHPHDEQARRGSRPHARRWCPCSTPTDLAGRGNRGSCRIYRSQSLHRVTPSMESLYVCQPPSLTPDLPLPISLPPPRRRRATPGHHAASARPSPLTL
jgi:hypothetical protein